MGLFDSIFGIDITGDGEADFLDDSIILASLEEEKRQIELDESGDDEGPEWYNDNISKETCS